MVRGTTLLVGFLFAIAAHASDAGTSSPDAGPLAYKAKPAIFFSEDPTVFEKLILAKPAERAAMKGILQKLTIGKRAAAIIVVEGYELPFSRRVDLQADIVITDPTGRVILDKASVSGAQTMDPKTMLLVPLAPTFGMVFGLTDPEGDYKVRITLWDQIRGASSIVETKFTVTR